MDKVKNKSGVYFSTFVWTLKKDDNYLETCFWDKQKRI